MEEGNWLSHFVNEGGDPGEATDNEQQESLEPAPADKKSRLRAALRRIHARLSDNAELLKLHLKHYHMSTKNFRSRTSQLQIPEAIFKKYDEIV